VRWRKKINSKATGGESSRAVQQTRFSRIVGGRISKNGTKEKSAPVFNFRGGNKENGLSQKKACE